MDSQNTPTAQTAMPAAEKPKKERRIGLIRFFEIMWVINIIATVLSLIMLKKGQWDLDFEGWRNLFNIVLEGITLWLLWQRKKAARFAIIGFAALSIVLGTAFNVVTGNFTPFTAVLNSLFDIVLILYFGFSRTAKEVLVMPFDEKLDRQLADEDATYFSWKTWPFWRNLVMFFCVFSVAGHWMEACFCLLVKYGIFPGVYDPNSQIWSDYLFPFPVYGVGFCVCVLLFFPIKQWLCKKFKGLLVPLVLSFIISTIVCAGIELAMGLATNMPAHPGDINPLWDYSDMPFNFMGQICLLYSSAFGVAATIVTWLVYPAIMRALSHVSREGMNIMFTAVLVGYALLTAMYLVTPPAELDHSLEEHALDESGSVIFLEIDESGELHSYVVVEPSQSLQDAIKAEAEAENQRLYGEDEAANQNASAESSNTAAPTNTTAPAAA